MSYKPSLFWERLIKSGVPNRLGFTFEKRRALDLPVSLLACMSSRIRPIRFCLGRNFKEQLAYLGVFRARKMVDDYSSTMSKLNVRSTALTARMYWNAMTIEGLAEKHLSLKKGSYHILELGAGGGVLSVMMSMPISEYQIIDLHEMLIKSKTTMDTYKHFVSKRHYSFGTPEEMARLPSKHFDIIISTFALQEMDREQRDGYIKDFYRIGKEGALVYTIDRRQPRLPLRDGSTWDNNPLLYPWSHKDKVLIFEECPIHELARTKWGMQANISYLRAAIINLP